MDWESFLWLSLKSHRYAHVKCGGPCRGRTYGPLIKSPAPIQSQNTQGTQDNQISPLSEDEE